MCPFGRRQLQKRILCQLVSNAVKPALYLIGEQEIPLCLDCYERHDNILQRQLDENARMLNYAQRKMEVIAGIPLGSLGPGIQIQQRPQPMTFNNIRVTGSAIGAINTGQAHNIDTAVTFTKNAGDEQLSTALKDFTQAVLDDTKINQQNRDAIIEQMSFIATEITKERDKRQRSIARAVLANLKEIISTSAGLLMLWDKLEKLLLAAF